MEKDDSKRKHRNRKSKNKKKTKDGKDVVKMDESGLQRALTDVISEQCYQSTTDSSDKTSTPQELTPQEFIRICFAALDRTSDPSIYSGSPTRIPIARGFVNSGNTCFVNSVLQSLFATPALLRFLVELLPQLSSPIQTPSRSMPYWCSLLDLAQDALTTRHPIQHTHPTNDGSIHTGVTTVPVSSMPAAYMGQAEWDFRLQICGQEESGGSCRRQMDSAEYLTFLLDQLHEEMRLATEPVQDAYELDDGGGWNEVSRGGATSKVDRASKVSAKKLNSASIISRIFHGTLRSEVKFHKKKANSITFQRFHCLALDLQQPQQHSHHHHHQQHEKIAGGYGVESDDSGDGCSIGSVWQTAKNLGRGNKKAHTISQHIPTTGVNRGGRGRVSLLQIFEDYFREEVLSDSSLRKTVSIETPPSTLILTLKRFAFDTSRGTTVKVQTEVEFPTLLHIPPSCLSADLLTTLQLHRQQKNTSSILTCGAGGGRVEGGGKRVCGDDDNEDEGSDESTDDDDDDDSTPGGAPADTPSMGSRPLLTYKLQGVILHHGQSADSGHYTCFCLDNNAGLPGQIMDNMWRHVDDTSITRVTTAQVLAATKQAYVLLYCRQ